METTKPTSPLAFKVALINLTLGGGAFISSVLLTSLTSGFSQLASGVFLLGLGEYLNNPVYISPSTNPEDVKKVSFWQRRRSVCALGNLLDIGGVIMIAIGAATSFF